MTKNCQRTRTRKIQDCAGALRIVKVAIQHRLGIVDIPLVPLSGNSPNTGVDTKLLSPKRVAEVLGVSQKTLANWRCSGTQRLPHIKVGSRIFYRSSDVHAFILNNSKTSTSDQGGNYARTK